MNPETIIAELRGINAWRRGDETIEQPEPTHFGEVLDAAADEIAKLLGAIALGQENCDAEYETLREERDIARDGLRDSHIHAEQLAARVKELEACLVASRADCDRRDEWLDQERSELAALRAAIDTARKEVQP